jgi:hypothetical protein
VSTNKIKDLVTENFPNWLGIMIIKSPKDFEVLAAPNSPFKTYSDENYKLENIATLVAQRFPSLGFFDILDGLDLTMNMFGTYCLCTTVVHDKLFSIIFPKDEDVTKTYVSFKKTANEIRSKQLL